MSDRIVGTEWDINDPNWPADGASGVQQCFYAGDGCRMTRENYVQVLSFLEHQMLNNGVILMNRKTAKNMLKWDRAKIGGGLAAVPPLEGTGIAKAAAGTTEDDHPVLVLV